jgi:hypothetical protein
MLVDPTGTPMAGDWKTSSTPSVAWDLTKETDPTLVKELRSGLHSERIASLFLKLRMNGANSTSTEGFSERIPCESANNECRLNLENRSWFPNLSTMRYLTSRPTTPEAKKAGTDAPSWLEAAYRDWEAAGMPIGRDASVRMANHRLFSTPDSANPQGAAASALAAGTDPGGIDFSTLQLRYLSEGVGGQLQYVFGASPGTGGKTADGQIAAAQSSDAFFVWLSLPPSTFWVNLNPSEPDRIIDAKLGTTDVGRILLEADFRMKKVVGKLIHPDTTIGKQFWGDTGQVGNSCIDMRQWIVPKPASVYEQGGGLYIVDAPLEVKMETDYLKQQGVQGSCTTPDARMESTFHTLVLPKVEDAVNHSPDFADLRRVYLSRVAAEWYRQKHHQGTLLSSLIDSNDVSTWPALQSWSPRQVFDQYVDAYKTKEFNITKQITQGNEVYQMTYTYGGVDFSNVVLHAMSEVAFQQQHPGTSSVVHRSYQQPIQDERGMFWLGATSRPVLQGNLNDPASIVPVATSRRSFWYVVAAPLVLWLLAGVLLVVRRRTRRS